MSEKRDPQDSSRLIVWETTSMEGYIVQLTADTFCHIVQGHPEMADSEELIRGTVSMPHMIVQSPKFTDTRIYGRYDVIGGRFEDYWLLVPVSYQVGGIGTVDSAYPSEKPKKGKIIYCGIKK